MRTNLSKAAGFYFLELALIVPLALAAVLSIADCIKILTTYSHFKEVSLASLRNATTISGRAITISEPGHSILYAWYRHSWRGNSLHSSPNPITYSATPPGECFSSPNVSCTAEFNGTLVKANSALREINTDIILQSISTDPMIRALVGRNINQCTISTETGCVHAQVTLPGEDDLSAEEIQVSITANIPTIFLKFILEPITGRESVQIQILTTQNIETHFVKQEPLIRNSGFNSTF
jgi:hypothetical protein